MTHIDYSISRVDDLGAIHEATYNRTWFEIMADLPVIHTGIQITYPNDYPNYALRGVKIWYSIESLTTLL